MALTAATLLQEPEDAALEAVARTVKHREKLLAANHQALPHLDKAVADESLRMALTGLVTGEQTAAPPAGAELSLRYIRDRVNVPRDMSIWAARRLRTSLEAVAQQAAAGGGDPAQPPRLAIPVRHRRDQDPLAFR